MSERAFSVCDFCKHAGNRLAWTSGLKEAAWKGEDTEEFLTCSNPDIFKPLWGVIEKCDGFKLKVQKIKKKRKKKKKKK